MLELGIGTMAGAHIALSTRNVNYELWRMIDVCLDDTLKWGSTFKYGWCLWQ